MTITEGVLSGDTSMQHGKAEFVSGPWQDSINLRDFIQRN